jgi:hypothetical protein
MANGKVCISSDIIENVKAMKDRAVLTQIQAFGDVLNGKFNDFQYQAVNQSMEKVVNECDNILEVLSVENGNCYIVGDFVSKAEKIAHAMTALAKVA